MGLLRSTESLPETGTVYVLSGQNTVIALAVNLTLPTASVGVGVTSSDYRWGNEGKSVLLGEARTFGCSTTDRTHRQLGNYLPWTGWSPVLRSSQDHPCHPRCSPPGTVSSLLPGMSGGCGEVGGRIQGQPFPSPTLLTNRMQQHRVPCQ